MNCTRAPSIVDAARLPTAVSPVSSALLPQLRLRLLLSCRNTSCRPYRRSCTPRGKNNATAARAMGCRRRVSTSIDILQTFQTGPIRFSPAGLNFGWDCEMKMKNPKRVHPAWCDAVQRGPRRAGRGGQSCAYETPGMGHGDVDMPDVHFDFIDSRAVDDEQRPTAAEVDAAAFTTAKVIAWLAKLKGSLKVAGHKRDRKVADLKQKLKKLCHCMLAADVRHYVSKSAVCCKGTRVMPDRAALINLNSW